MKRAYLTASEIKAEYLRERFTNKRARIEIEIAREYWKECLEFYHLPEIEILPQIEATKLSRKEYEELMMAIKERRRLNILQKELPSLPENELLKVNTIAKYRICTQKQLHIDNNGLEAASTKIQRLTPHEDKFRYAIEAGHLKALDDGKYQVYKSAREYFEFMIESHHLVPLVVKSFVGILVKPNGEVYKKKSLDQMLKVARAECTPGSKEKRSE